MGNDGKWDGINILSHVYGKLDGWVADPRENNNTPNLPPTHLLQLVIEGLHSKDAGIIGHSL